MKEVLQHDRGGGSSPFGKDDDGTENASPCEIAFPAVDIIIFNNMSCFHFTQRRRQIDYRFSTILVTC
jgi:hypothetical protein